LYLVEYQAIRDQLISQQHPSSMDPSGAASPPPPPQSSSSLDLLNKLKTLENRVLAILDGASSVNTEYDISNALLLMHSFGFENGEMFLIEKLQSTDLILRRCIETGNERGIMRVLKREGRKDPELFVQVLTYFVRLSMTAASSSSSDGQATSGHHHRGKQDDDEEEDRDEYASDDDERWDLISEVLTLVEKENVLTPMQIIPILSENPDLPLHIASRFLKRTLRDTSEDLINLEREVSHMKRIVQGVIQEGIAARQHKLNQQQAALVGGEKKRGANTSTRSGSLIASGLPSLSFFFPFPDWSPQTIETTMRMSWRCNKLRQREKQRRKSG
jgi:hypothetical protein